MHDVVAVGFGPSGLALAVAVEEQKRPLDALFLERKPGFSWHEGMLIPDARMQVSCLKDLATLRDPRSRFTFLQYLKEAGRLNEFVNIGTLRPTRLEFNEYLRWTADQLRRRVRYRSEVTAVEPVTRPGGRVGGLRITVRDLQSGIIEEHLTRNVVLGAGGTPNLPPGVDTKSNRRMLHSSDFLHHMARHCPDRDAELRIVVIGDGQSAAEIFEYLDANYQRSEVTAVTRGIGYRPMDETPFVNEVFFPRWVDAFHGLGKAKRAGLLATLRNTNYAAVDQSLIERIYRRVYEARVTGTRRVALRPFLDFRSVVDGPSCVALELEDWLNDRSVRIEADIVVFATGYSMPNPHPLLAGLAPYLETDDSGSYRLGRDYRVAAKGHFMPGVFVQGYAQGSHGISDTLLSVACVRAAEIAESVGALASHQRREAGSGAPDGRQATNGGKSVYVHRFDADRLQGDNDKRGFRIVPADDLPALPFGAMWSLIGPGSQSSREMHHECELFVIAEGVGEARVGRESRAIAAGDAVYVPPFAEHAFTNTSTDDELRYLSVWWEDGPLVRQTEDQWNVADEERPATKVLVTATPPTVNGELHLGHISGPYLAADICRRYLTLRGRDVLYVSGSDENQSYVVTKARQKGWTPRATADHFGDRVEEAFAALDIRPQVFARPSTSPYHTRLCQEFFARLFTIGKLERRTSPSLRCDRCDRYLFEAHVSGFCPHCGHSSDGSACEDCARPNDCVDLLDPRCKQCGATPNVRDVERLYFPLSSYESQLREYLATVTMSGHMRALCETMLGYGLPDIPVTHLAEWGIPVRVPDDGFEDQVIYVWLEMCPGYLAATQQAVEQGAVDRSWEDVWKEPGTEIVQFFGFDNGYFHALLFPALLMAYDSGITLPSTFVTNEFYLLEAEKFSSSREHAIWATEFAAQEPADWVRFYLSLDRPEVRRTNFTLANYEATVRTELEDKWLTWLRKLGRRLIDEFGGLAPVTATYTVAQRKFFRTLARLIREMEESLDTRTFSPPQAVRILCDVVHTADTFGTAHAYLAGVGARHDDRRTALALELAAARCLATMAAPVLPDLASNIWTALGCEGDGPPRWEAAPAFIPEGQYVGGLCDLAPW